MRSKHFRPEAAVGGFGNVLIGLAVGAAIALIAYAMTWEAWT